MESKKWAEFYRNADEKTQAKHLETFLELIKFYEMKIWELQELIRIVLRANQGER
jgi:hypothetical protein